MTSIRVEVSVSAPLGEVWRAWAESDQISKWFAPEANIEARICGPFELFFDPSDHGHESTIGCVFTLVEPMRRLGFNWKGPDRFATLMNDPGRLTHVTVNFHDEDSEIRVVVDHAGWGEGEEWEQAMEWHRRAWEDVLGNLKRHLETEEN